MDAYLCLVEAITCNRSLISSLYSHLYVRSKDKENLTQQFIPLLMKNTMVQVSICMSLHL